MSSASRRIHAANSPAESRDQYIDYVNRYYDMIQQEKLSNKKKVEEAIQRQNFDVDQIQATNASGQAESSPEPAPAFHPPPPDQHNFRNAPRGDNFYPASPGCCDATADPSTALTPYKYSSPAQRVPDERSYEIVPSAAPVQPPAPHYDAYPPAYYYPPPALPPRPCTCTCFRPPALGARPGYDGRELAPVRDYRAHHWHDNAAFRYDKCGDVDYAQHAHPYAHYAHPYYGAPAQQPQQPQPPPFNPVEMTHSNANSYNYFSARAPLVAKHAPCVYNVSSPLVAKDIQRAPPPQKPPSTSFMNSMRLEWEKNFNAARIERGNNLLKNR